MTPIRVLHICALPSYSGLEQYALKLAVEERKRGVNVGFVALKDSELEREARLAEVPTFAVDFHYKRALLSAARAYSRIIAELPGLEVIHLHSSQDIDRICLVRLMGARGLKVIQQNHVWISHSKRDPIHWLTHQALDEIWCSSERAKADILKYLPVPESKVEIIRYGRDLSIATEFLSRDEARSRLGLPQDALVIGAIARIDKPKGVWELLTSSVELSRRGFDFHTIIVGGPTMTDPVAIEFSEKVERFHRELPPEYKARIHLPGGIPNAGRLLKAFDLYAQVAYKETFSLALLDAQLAERPVIGTNSGGTPEVVREGETGWLARPEDAVSLAETIERALENRDSWAAFGTRARARVEKDFDLNVVIPEIIRRYRLK